MNKQEAIERLKSLSRMFDEAPTGAIYEAISALEKQIPKKPLEDSTDEKTHYKCICGSIQKTVYIGGYRLGAERAYCDRCGQAIDWRNEDE